MVTKLTDAFVRIAALRIDIARGVVIYSAALCLTARLLCRRHTTQASSRRAAQYKASSSGVAFGGDGTAHR
jgi:hypothetical protein